MLQVQGTGYELGKTDITYKFTVKLANQEWDIFRCYKDFVKLDTDLATKYGKPNLPQLTGTVYLRVLSDATGVKRLPKLEDYLTQVLSSWKASFKNPKYFEIPNPKGSRFPNILIEITMAQFLEIGEHYEAVVEDDDDDDDDDDEEDSTNDESEGNDNSNVNNDDDNHDENIDDGNTSKIVTPKKKNNNDNLGWSDDEDAEPVPPPTASQQRFILEEQQQQQQAPPKIITTNASDDQQSKSNSKNSASASATAAKSPLLSSSKPPTATSLGSTSTTTTTTSDTSAAKTSSSKKATAAKQANILSQLEQKTSTKAQELTKNEKKAAHEAEMMMAAQIQQQQQQKQQKPSAPDDDFDVIDEHKDTFEATHVLAQMRTMTSEIDIIVKDYIIHPSAYIEYNFQITFCGFSWKVTKRFSEFVAFYDSLMKEIKGTEFVDYVPPIEDVQFSSWRKCDPDVAEFRSVWLTNFFKIIAPVMDEWFPSGNLTHFKIRRKSGEEEDELDRYASHDWIKVAVNRILFDWFHFVNYISEFSALDAEKVAKQNEKLLPSFIQKNLESVRKEEERAQREKNIAYRNSFMEKLNETEFQDLIRIISSFDDDRHCLALLEFFVKNGYYYPGKTRVERIQELDSQKAIQEKRRLEALAATSRSSGGAGGAGNTPLKSANSTQQQQQHQRQFSNSGDHNNNNNIKNANGDDGGVAGGGGSTSAANRWRMARNRLSSISPGMGQNTNFGHQSTVQQQQQQAASTNYSNNMSFGDNYSGYNNNNNNYQHQQQQIAPTTTSQPAFTRNIDQSMYFRSSKDEEDEHEKNVNMDIFDQMQQSSAIFGATTSIKDFASLVTSAVNAAKDQLRGRTRNTAAAAAAVTSNNNNKITTITSNGGDEDDSYYYNEEGGNRGGVTSYKDDRKRLTRPCGLTSLQIAKVAEAIPFNDTRAASITVLSPLLLDLDHFGKIFETLEYDWELAETTLTELLSKKEAPENFKFTPSAPPSLPF